MKLGVEGSLAIGGAIASAIGEKLQEKRSASASPSSFKRGGKVKKTGRARVHRGERVLTKKQDVKYQKIKRGKRSTGKR